MSAHAGVCHFDGRPPSSRLVSVLEQVLDDFGPDGGGACVQPGIVMMHLALTVTREDVLERQPFRSADGSVLTWDGRLDNRHDLQLQLAAELGDGRSDGALAMAAYEKWGADGFRHLIGDWSLAVWNPSRRAVVLASDFAGNRGLYYSNDADQTVWASSLAALLAMTGRREISRVFVTGYLTATIPPGTTPYEGVFCVPPAHLVTCMSGGVTVRRFWDYGAGSIRYRDSDQYACHLRELVTDAVRSRMRAKDPVWVELSGGLDSSTIACVAQRLQQLGTDAAPGVETISCYTDESPDERIFIEAVEQQCGHRTHYLRIEDSDGATDVERAWVHPRHPSNINLREYEYVCSRGGRVVMSGHPGDVVFGNTGYDPTGPAQLLAEGSPLAAIRMARAWSLASHRTIWQVLNDALGRIGPAALRIRRQLRHTLDDQGGTDDRGFDAAARERFFLPADGVSMWRAEVERRAMRARTLRGVANETLWSTLSTLLDDRRFQTPSEYPGLSLTFPFLHRPLIGFVLALPIGVLNAPGQPRALMKRAFSGVLPARIALRFSKGRLTEPFRRRVIRTFAEAHGDDVGALYLVQQGFVDRDALMAELRGVRSHGVRRLRNLLEVVRLESWLRRCYTRTQSGPTDPLLKRAGADVLLAHTGRDGRRLGEAPHGKGYKRWAFKAESAISTGDRLTRR